MIILGAFAAVVVVAMLGVGWVLSRLFPSDKRVDW